MIAKRSMKFKAFLTDTGVQLLEKMGRSCHVYITPSHFCFLHNLRLLKKLTPHSPLPSPFLTFEARGHSSALIQDVPVTGLITLGSEFRSLLVMGEKADMPDGGKGETR